MPKSKKPALFNWKPVAIYLAIVAAGAAGVVFWERAYEAKELPLAVPASFTPDVVARRMVESYVGTGTVQSSHLDPQNGVLTMVVRDVVSDKGKTPAERRDLLSAEGTQAVERLLGSVAFKHVVLELVRDGKVLATVRAEPGKKPQTEFARDLP